jgi:hypothetical protein
MYEIPLWFLLIGLFVPRIVLLIAYCSGAIPPNNLPFIGDFFLTLFLPRVLIMLYIAGVSGISNPWFWVYGVIQFFEFLMYAIGTAARSTK